MVSQPAIHDKNHGTADATPSTRNGRRIIGLSGSGIFLLAVAAGCYHPGAMHGGSSYGSPMYAPPMQMAPGSNGVPGQLVIPEDSNAPLYTPGSGDSTFDYDDGFEKSNSDDGSFYGTGGSNTQPVPEPRDPGAGASRPFEDDYNRGASLSSPAGQLNARPASATADVAGVVRYAHAPNYSWLKGFLHFDDATQTWNMTYSLSQTEDEYGGDLTLLGDPAIFTNLRSGTIVHVSGGLYPQQRDSRGMPMYRAVAIEPIDLNPVR